jgi:hypothetical protein
MILSTLSRCTKRLLGEQHLVAQSGDPIIASQPRRLLKQRHEQLQVAARQLREDGRHHLEN